MNKTAKATALLSFTKKFNKFPFDRNIFIIDKNIFNIHYWFYTISASWI